LLHETAELTLDGTTLQTTMVVENQHTCFLARLPSACAELVDGGQTSGSTMLDSTTEIYIGSRSFSLTAARFKLTCNRS
jgi:hypothetical protein